MNSESSVADSPLYRIRLNRNREVNELAYPNNIEPQVYTITMGEGNVKPGTKALAQPPLRGDIG
jgi:hypothetical protein